MASETHDYRHRAKKTLNVSIVYGRGPYAVVSDAHRPLCVVLFEETKEAESNYYYQLKEQHAKEIKIVDLRTGRTLVDSKEDQQ